MWLDNKGRGVPPMLALAWGVGFAMALMLASMMR